VYAPWRAEADGWWHSASLALAIEATRPFLGVRDRDGRRILVARAIQEHAERQEQARAEEARQRVEAERARVEEARRRAEAERAHARAKQARLEAERQRDELAEQLRRLRERGGA